jgi:hypothetical protein
VISEFWWASNLKGLPHGWKFAKEALARKKLRDTDKVDHQREEEDRYARDATF